MKARLYGAIGKNGEWYVGGWKGSTKEDMYVWSDDWDTPAHDEQHFIVEVELPEYREPAVVEGKTLTEDGR